MHARVTPGWLRVIDTWLRRIAVLMKNTANTVTALATKAMAANTAALAASIGSRFGTASSDARIAPVEYSLLITITPRTQRASWPRPNPAPKISAVGLVTSVTWLGWLPGAFHWRDTTLATSVLKPIATATNAKRDQRVERTERIFVHSAVSRPAVTASPPCRTRHCRRS